MTTTMHLPAYDTVQKVDLKLTECMNALDGRKPTRLERIVLDALLDCRVQLTRDDAA